MGKTTFWGLGKNSQFRDAYKAANNWKRSVLTQLEKAPHLRNERYFLSYEPFVHTDDFMQSLQKKDAVPHLRLSPAREKQTETFGVVTATSEPVLILDDENQNIEMLDIGIDAEQSLYMTDIYNCITI